MGLIFSETPGAAVLRDEIEVARQVSGFRPDPVSGREPVDSESAAKAGFTNDPVDRAYQAFDVLEDESSVTLRDQLRQCAQVANNYRGPFGKRFEYDIAEGFVYARRHDDGGGPSEEGGHL